MPMKVSEFNKLKNLMMLTTSDNDHEALAALRKANSILKTNGYDWNATFGRLVKVQDEIEAAPQDRTAKDIDAQINEAFDTIEATDPKGGFADFIASLHEQWADKHYLTPAQKEALFKAADRATHFR